MATLPVIFEGENSTNALEFGFVVSCRRDAAGKRAIGLDCHFAYDCKDALKALGAKWDSRDKTWFFIFNTPDALKLMVGTMRQIIAECCEAADAENPRPDYDFPVLSYEPGIHAESIVVPALRKISAVNNEPNW